MPQLKKAAVSIFSITLILSLLFPAASFALEGVGGGPGGPAGTGGLSGKDAMGGYGPGASGTGGYGGDSPGESGTSGPGGGANSGGGFGPSGGSQSEGPSSGGGTGTGDNPSNPNAPGYFGGYGPTEAPADPGSGPSGGRTAGPGTTGAGVSPSDTTAPADPGSGPAGGRTAGPGTTGKGVGPTYSNEDSRVIALSPKSVTDITDLLSTIENPVTIGIPTAPVSPIGVVNTPTISAVLSPQTTATKSTNQQTIDITDDLSIAAGRMTSKQSPPTSVNPTVTPLSYYSPILGRTVTLTPISMIDPLAPKSHTNSTFATPMSFYFADPQDPNSKAASYDIGMGNTLSIDPISAEGTISDEDGKVLGYVTADEAMSMIADPDVTVSTPNEVGVIGAAAQAAVDGAKAVAEATAAGLRGLAGWLGLNDEDDDSRVVDNPPGTVADPFGNKNSKNDDKDESRLAADETNPFAAPTTVEAPAATPAAPSTRSAEPAAAPATTPAPTTAQPEPQVSLPDTAPVPETRAGENDPDQVFSDEGGRFPSQPNSPETAPAGNDVSLPDTAPTPTASPGFTSPDDTPDDQPGDNESPTPDSPNDPGTEPAVAEPDITSPTNDTPSSQPTPNPNNENVGGGLIDILRDLIFGQSRTGSDPVIMTKLCPPYPITCEDEENEIEARTDETITGRNMVGLSLFGLTEIDLPNPFSSLQSAFIGLFGDNDTDQPSDTDTTIPSYVPVTVTVNYQTQQVDIERPDITESLKNPSLYYSTSQLAQMRKLLNETPFLFGAEGEVVYSNGLYSPPVINGLRQTKNIPKYAYALKIIDQNGNTVQRIDDNTALSSSGVVARIMNYVLGNAAEFTTLDVSSVDYYTLDPDSKITGDEYYQYSIELNNGTIRHITVPKFASISQISRRFGQIGFTGDAIELVIMADEADISIEKPIGILGRLRSFFGDNSDKEAPTDDNFFASLLKETASNYLSADDIERLIIYTNTDMQCPHDVPGYDRGFMYKAILKDRGDPNYRIVISDGRCGTGNMNEYVTEAVRHLREAHRVRNVSVNSVQNKTFSVSERLPFSISSSRIFVGVTDEEESQTSPPVVTGNEASGAALVIPNRTNAVTLEIKAIGADGKVLSDWIRTTGVTISSDVQLHFRWSANEYEQCLPFLQDGGSYALAKGGASMTTGNTETDGFNVPEKSAVYRVECGGQRNGEYGVDERAIEVVVQ